MGETGFITVAGSAAAEFTERRSRFIGSIFHVTSEEEAVDNIAAMKKRYWDANHNVPCYIIRGSGAVKCSDDGEPQGTAGLPALDTLKKEGLTDVCLVITRYFGGILLGGGGLVRAYSHTASLAVAAAGKREFVLSCRISLSCDYNLYQRLLRQFSDWRAVVDSADFSDVVRLQLLMPLEAVERFKRDISELSLGGVLPEIIGEEFMAY